MNIFSIPVKITNHFRRGGIWEVAYLITARLPQFPLPPRLKWLIGRRHEIDFWDRYFHTKGLYWKSGFQERFDANRALDSHVADVLKDFDFQDIRMLDVGAGPLTSLSRGCPNRRIEITAVDPLAHEYDRILAKYGYEPPIRTRFAAAENLAGMFPGNSFDVVHARNSIDHSYDPLKAIHQMLAVTRRCGFVILQHRPNEATNENWVGLHQWNFSKENEDFVIRSKNKLINIRHELAGVASVATELHDKEEWLVVKIKKLI